MATKRLEVGVQKGLTSAIEGFDSRGTRFLRCSKMRLVSKGKSRQISRLSSRYESRQSSH